MSYSAYGVPTSKRKIKLHILYNCFRSLQTASDAVKWKRQETNEKDAQGKYPFQFVKNAEIFYR
jgi:hypothetical protein